MPSGTILLYSTRILPKFLTTAGSFRTSKRELIATWSLPRVITFTLAMKLSIAQEERPLTNGKKALRVSVIAYVSWTTGVNCNILGYMSNGEIVPEVMTTLLKCSKTGLIANEGSRHLSQIQKMERITGKNTDVKWKIGFGTVALSVSNGSRMSRKPENLMVT